MTEPTPVPTREPAIGRAATALSPQDQQALVGATALLRPLRRAARIASFNGAFYSIFGVLSLMFAIPGKLDWVGLLVGIALIIIGLLEHSAARRLGDGGPREPLRIARIELAALGVIVSYCLLQMYGPSETNEELSRHASEFRQAGIDIEALTQQLTLILYPTLIATSVIVQGLLARYFLGKRAVMTRYLDEVPEWARKVVESMAG